MNVFVTGGTGFIGSRLIRRVVETMPEVRVHALVRTNSSRWRIEDLSQNITFHEGDITDAESLARALAATTPTHLFHFANAGVYGGVSVRDEESLRINTGGLVTLLEAARPYAYEAFVNIGSSSEYGVKHAPMAETDSCEPVSGYGIAKLRATEAATLEAKTHSKPVATFRYFSPYGPQDDPSRLISKAIANLLYEKEFRLPHPASVRDYVFVDDTIALLLEASQKLLPHSGEVFNLGSGSETKAATVVEEIAKRLGKEEFLATLSVPEGALGPTESPRWVADMSKTFAAFSWRPTTTLTEGIQETIAFVRTHPEQYPV